MELAQLALKDLQGRAAGGERGAEKQEGAGREGGLGGWNREKSGNGGKSGKFKLWQRRIPIEWGDSEVTSVIF